MSINNRLINVGGVLGLPCPDLTNASYDGNGSITVSGYGTSARGCFDFKLDGTKAVFSSASTVTEVNFSTPFDLSTATIGNTATMPNANNVYNHRFRFSEDGANLYVLNFLAPAKIWQIKLSTPWDVTTMSTYASVSYDTTYNYALTISKDGTKLILGSPSGSPTLQLYTLSTPFELSTATLTTTHTIGASSGALYGHEISADGTKYFFMGQQGNISQYSFGTPFDILVSAIY